MTQIKAAFFDIDGTLLPFHAKALPVQQFFKALRYRNLKPAEQENGTVPRDEVVFEHTLG